MDVVDAPVAIRDKRETAFFGGTARALSLKEGRPSCIAIFVIFRFRNEQVYPSSSPSLRNTIIKFRPKDIQKE